MSWGQSACPMYAGVHQMGVQWLQDVRPSECSTLLRSGVPRPTSLVMTTSSSAHLSAACLRLTSCFMAVRKPWEGAIVGTRQWCQHLRRKSCGCKVWRQRPLPTWGLKKPVSQ
jgi:hypothetical protein